MKVRNKIKMMLMVTMTTLCVFGCTQEVPKEENVTQGSVSGTEHESPKKETQDSVKETVKEETKESAEESTKEETKDSEQETAKEETSEKQESVADEIESSEIQIDFEIKKVLEEAESEASVLEKKLTEDASLTQKDMNNLSYEIYQVWDKVLNEMWKVLKDNLEEETMDKLLEEQRAWIVEKEAEVKKAGEEFAGGSIVPLVSNQKAAKLTKERVYELADYFGAR